MYSVHLVRFNRFTAKPLERRASCDRYVTAKLQFFKLYYEKKSQLGSCRDLPRDVTSPSKKRIFFVILPRSLLPFFVDNNTTLDF